MAQVHDTRAALFGCTREHGRVYVLVDRFELNPAVEMLQAEANRVSASWFALQDEIFEEAPERAPALLQLSIERAGHLELLDQSVDLAFAEVGRPLRSVCGWLFIEGDVVRATRAMSRRLDVQTPTGRVYLRYFDPRVLPQLLRLFGERAAADLLAPVHTWFLLSRDGQQCRFDVPVLTTARLSLRLDAKEAAMIDRIQLVNEAAACLLKWGLDAGHEHDADLNMALQAATDVGLVQSIDQVCYAVHACAQGTRFTEHPDLPSWLNLARQGVPLEAVLEESRLMAPISGINEKIS